MAFQEGDVLTNDQGQQVTLTNNQWVPVQQGGFPLSNILEPAATVASGLVAEPLAGFAGIAQAINPFADPGAGAEAVEATREALTFQPRTAQGQAGLQALGETLQPASEFIQSLEKGAGDIGFEAAGPLGGAIGTTSPTAALTALGFAPVRRVLSLGKKAKAADKTAKRLLGESAPTADNLKQAAREIYNDLDDVGAVVDSSRINRLGRDLTSIAKRQGIDETLHPKATAALRKITESGNLDLNLTEIDTLRKVAKAAAESIDPSDARLGSLMVDKVDDFLDGLKPSDFAKGKKEGAGVKFKEARQLWQRAKKSELLDDAFEKARNQASGFENGVRTQFRSLLNNKKKMRGFTPEEKTLMQQVVRGGAAENIAKKLGKLGFGEGQSTSMLLGSLGIAGGAAVGGPAGAVAVPLIGTVSAKLAQKLTRNNAELTNTIVRAGKDSDEIVRAYMKAIPVKERNVGELTELLMRPDVSLKKLKKTPINPTPQQKLSADAVFFADFLQSQQEDE